MAGDLWGVLVGGLIGLAGSFAPHWWTRLRMKPCRRVKLVGWSLMWPKTWWPSMKLDGIRIDLRLMAMRRMDNLPVPQKIEVLERDLALWMK